VTFAGSSRHPAEGNFKVETVAWHDLPAKAGPIDSAEERQTIGETLIGQHSDRAQLRQ
jgi:hypothetical protein